MPQYSKWQERINVPLVVPAVLPPGRKWGRERNRDREKQLCKTYALGEGQHVLIFLLVPLGGETKGKDQTLPIGTALKARGKKISPFRIPVVVSYWLLTPLG